MFTLESLGIKRDEKILTLADVKPVYAFSKEKISDVNEKLVESSHRSLPVVDKQLMLQGMVSISDILDAFLKKESFDQEISSIMAREVISCDANESIGFVLQKMKISKKGRLPVLSGRKLLGVIGERDYVFRSREEAFQGVKNEDVMTKKPFFLKPNDTVLDCIKSMVNAKYRRLPIVDRGRLVGYITSTHLFKELVKEGFKQAYLKKSLEEVMVKEPITLGPGESLRTTVKLMKEKVVSSMLIVDESKKLLGIITERDILELME